MEDPIQRARLRFKSILESAEQAADWAVQDRPGITRPTSLVVIATKAMNRATGFLEAVSIVVPELGPELLEEFESFAARVETLSAAAQASGERRINGIGRSPSDRREGDRRARHERRRQSVPIAVERRLTHERRAEPDRRTGRIRELADRRWRATQH